MNRPVWVEWIIIALYVMMILNILTGDTEHAIMDGVLLIMFKLDEIKKCVQS